MTEETFEEAVARFVREQDEGPPFAEFVRNQLARRPPPMYQETRPAPYLRVALGDVLRVEHDPTFAGNRRVTAEGGTIPAPPPPVLTRKWSRRSTDVDVVAALALLQEIWRGNYVDEDE